MERFPDEIVEHYDREIDEAQRITQGLGQLELLRTREIVRRHLPPGPQRILDDGGGTGDHAAWQADGVKVIDNDNAGTAMKARSDTEKRVEGSAV